MGGSLSQEQLAHAKELRTIIQQSDSNVPLNSLEDFIKEIEFRCPWYPAEGSLKHSDWHKIGEALFKEPRAAVNHLLIWHKIIYEVEKITPEAIPDEPLVIQELSFSSPKATSDLSLPPKPSALQATEGVNQTSEKNEAAFFEEEKEILSDTLPAQVSSKLQKTEGICYLQSGSLKVANEHEISDGQLHMENVGRDDLPEIVLPTPSSLIFTEFSSASSLDTIIQISKQADVGENSSHEIVQQRVNYTNAAQGGEYLSSGSEKFSALEQEVQSISGAVFLAFEMVPKLIQELVNENTNADFEPVIHRQFSYELAETLKQEYKPKGNYFDSQKLAKPPWKGRAGFPYCTLLICSFLMAQGLSGAQQDALLCSPEHPKSYTLKLRNECKI